MLKVVLTRQVPGALLLATLVLLQSPPADAALPDLKLVLALTEPTQQPPVTTLFLHDVKSGIRTDIYQDSDGEKRVLVRIASSDVLRTVRLAGSSTIYAMRGPAQVESPASCPDTLSRLHLRLGGDPTEWEPIFPVPLCFSHASPYGLWNRAPIFSVSADGGRVAVPVVRIGDAELAQPSIRILSATGAEEWLVPLPGEWMEVADLAWSADAKRLAYLVRPQGDEHTVEEAELADAGLYLADVETRRTRRISDCQADAVAWGPSPNQITIAAGPLPGAKGTALVSVLALPGGTKVEEFSAQGAPLALAYSPDREWLAVQTIDGTKQAIWLHPVSGGWGRRVYELPTAAGRLSLVGWASGPVGSGEV